MEINSTRRTIYGILESVMGINQFPDDFEDKTLSPYTELSIRAEGGPLETIVFNGTEYVKNLRSYLNKTLLIDNIVCLSQQSNRYSGIFRLETTDKGREVGLILTFIFRNNESQSN